ncbi:MAG: DMT family transporter [Candidatus Doudnabacteria bacterium]|nr:DMT family transporter [Candidatus Doudnabacteria bacterium]
MRNRNAVYLLHMHYGILFALTALVAWAFDDFFIGRSSKRLGSVQALFFLAWFGTILLLPFSWHGLSVFVSIWSWGSPIITLCIALIVITLIAALADFEALRVGKLSAIDPLYAFEVPLTVGIAYLLIGETLSVASWILIVCMMVGMVLVSTKSLVHLKSIRLEKGLVFALTSILFMGGTNFLTGYGARLTSPVVINWISYAGLAVCTSFYLLYKGQLKHTLRTILQHPALLLGLGIADVIAWTSFAKSASLIPIGLTTAISEAYIGLAVLLGLYFNKEKLRRHQFIGIGIIIVGVVTLSYLSLLE